MKNLVDLRITLEIPCEDCLKYPENMKLDSESLDVLENLGQLTCSGCDGTGYQTELVSLAELKKLLDQA